MRCPNGVVKPDYDDPRRMEKITFRKELLHVIKPEETTIYHCTEYDNPSEETQLLVAVGSLSIKKGDIVVSAQAGGIFHKLQSITLRQNSFTEMRAEFAKLEDAITYADFSANVEMHEIDDAVSLEQVPPASLFDDVISGKVQLNLGTVVHALDDVTVHKCLGRMYMTSDSEEVASFNLVIKVEHSSNNVYRVGDILTSGKSSSFLETVVRVQPINKDIFVSTRLTNCNSLDTTKLKLSLPMRKTSCVGGDNNPGLLMFDKSTRINLDVDDVISGRESFKIFVKVLKVRSTGSFVILEVANIERVEKGSAVTLINVGDITERRVVRRKRDLKIEYTKKIRTSDRSGVSLYIKCMHVCLLCVL